MHRSGKTDSPIVPAGIKCSEIRSPSESDMQDLLALEHACFDAPYYRPHRFTPSEFVAYLRNPDAVFLAAMQRHLLVGYIAGYRGVRSRCRSARIESIAEANERAMQFFSTLGFKPVRRLAAYYGGRYDGLRLRRTL